MNIRKRFLLCLWGSLMVMIASAQQLTRMEYFFDHDPGHGQANQIQTVTAGDNVLSIPTEGLTAGSHKLYVRAQDSNGAWSATEGRTFYLFSTSSANIRRVEYFFDTDPGHGQGRMITEVHEGEQDIALSTDGLQECAHILFLRTQTDNGAWSATEAHPFYMSKEKPAQPTCVEYFFDTDPGYGKGMQTGVTEGTNQLSLSLGDLGYGAHVLFMRVADDKGGWSAVQPRPFFICDRDKGFIAMEYYYDTDPGQGKGTAITLPLYFRDSDPLVISTPTDGLKPGDHTVNLRGMDADGNWSEPVSRPFHIEGEEPPAPQQVADVAFAYNGRYATLTTSTEGATIHYTTDGSEPTTASAEYTEPFDVTGLVTLRALAVKTGMDASVLTTYEVPCYYDGTLAQVRAAGTFAQCFGWCDALAIDQLTVKGNLNNSDLTSLRSMAGLLHADLKSVNMDGNALPDNAFQGMNLITIEMPASITSAGNSMFASCNSLAAIGWNASVAVSSASMSGIGNPNLLLYVDAQNLAETSGVRNVVANGTAQTITLSDGTGNSNFYAMHPFTAQQISYTHTYGMETGYADMYGWETLALPFDVQTITHETRGHLTPFALSTGSRDERPFWLCSLTSSGWQEVPAVAANTPCIVAMPNNENYSEIYRLAGRVTYAATNVTVPVTSPVVSQAGSTNFVPTTLCVNKASGIYALNLTSVEGYRAGAVFVDDLREVRPFEAYRTAVTPAPRLLPIKDDMLTGIGDIVNTTTVGDAAVYDLAGRKLPARTLTSASGRIRKGIYIVNGKKILIK